MIFNFVNINKILFSYLLSASAQDTTTPPSDSTTPVPNPCEGITLSDCVIDAEIIVGSNPFPPSLCQKQCELIDTCTYWRHDGTTCYYLNSDYHQDCATFSGPVDADILSCLQVDQSTCGAIIEEECVYEGRDGKSTQCRAIFYILAISVTLEVGPHQISDVLECEEYCQVYFQLDSDSTF